MGYNPPINTSESRLIQVTEPISKSGKRKSSSLTQNFNEEHLNVAFYYFS